MKVSQAIVYLNNLKQLLLGSIAVAFFNGQSGRRLTGAFYWPITR
jgi:hypothetical protein